MSFLSCSIPGCKETRAYHQSGQLSTWCSAHYLGRRPLCTSTTVDEPFADGSSQDEASERPQEDDDDTNNSARIRPLPTPPGGSAFPVAEGLRFDVPKTMVEEVPEDGRVLMNNSMSNFRSNKKSARFDEQRPNMSFGLAALAASIDEVCARDTLHLACLSEPTGKNVRGLHALIEYIPVAYKEMQL